MAWWLKWMAGGLAFAGVGAALVLWAGWTRRSRDDAAFLEGLIEAGRRHHTGPIRFEDFEALPAPVARYFRFALHDGQPFIRQVRYHQTGQLRTGGEASRWLRFEAAHDVAPLSPGFMWDAKVDIMPLLHLRVRDGYVSGQGSGQMSVLSVLTIAREAGGIEMNSGALHRYLAEAVWYPTALLPASGVNWTAIDDGRALATLTDSGVTVSLEFRFNDRGEATGIYTPARWGRFDGRFEQAPWEGHFRDYQERDGIVIPMEGDVGWYTRDRWEPVWKGRIREVSFEFIVPDTPIER